MIWPPEGWLTKKQAAERLGLSESRVAAMLVPNMSDDAAENFRREQNQIRGKRDRNPSSNQLVVLFLAGDVERIAFERQNPTEVTKVPGKKLDKPGVDPLTELFQKTGLMSVRGLPRVQEPPQKPWITISEAAEYSGLPASAISKLVESGKLPALDCGPRPGGKWRVKRTDLDALEGDR